VLLEIFILRTLFGTVFELFFGTFFIKGELDKKWTKLLFSMFSIKGVLKKKWLKLKEKIVS